MIIIKVFAFDWKFTALGTGYGPYGIRLISNGYGKDYYCNNGVYNHACDSSHNFIIACVFEGFNFNFNVTKQREKMFLLFKAHSRSSKNNRREVIV